MAAELNQQQDPSQRSPEDLSQLNTQKKSCKGLRRDLWWAFHNLVVHPVMEIMYWIGLWQYGVRFHNWSVPPHDKSEKIEEGF